MLHQIVTTYLSDSTRRTWKEIDEKILAYLKRLPFSATTEMIAKDVGIAWYTAQMHLHKLEKEGKIRYFKIGRQNQWILSSKLR